MENSELTLQNNKISRKGEKPPHTVLHNSDKEKKYYWTYFSPLSCQMPFKDLPELFFVLFSLKKGRSRKNPINVKNKICFPNAYFKNENEISAI